MELKTVMDSNKRIIQSQEEERKRIGFELHEEVSQNLYSVYTGLEFIQAGLDPEYKNYAKEMSKLMMNTIREVRSLSAQLYPTTLASLGLRSALKSYTRLFSSNYKTEVQLTSLGEEYDIPEQESIAFFRSCQEALLYIAKYIEVEQVNITFTWGEKALELEMRVDGNGGQVEGFIEDDQFLAIAAIEQRIDLVGGSCQMTSNENGTTLTFVLPKGI